MIKKYKSLLVVVLLFVIFIVVAFNKDYLFPVDTSKVDIRGEITNISTYNGITTILVEGKIEEDTIFDKGSMRIDSNTKLYQGDDKKKITTKDLKVGDKVEAAYDGPVAESYPVQGTAKFIIKK